MSPPRFAHARPSAASDTPMKSRTVTRFATVVLVTTLAVTGIGVVLFVMGRSAPFPKNAWAFRGFELIFAVVFSVVGAIVARSKPQNPIGWMFGGVGLLAAIQFATEQYAFYALFTHHPALPSGVLAAWVQSWI